MSPRLSDAIEFRRFRYTAGLASDAKARKAATASEAHTDVVEPEDTGAAEPEPAPKPRRRTAASQTVGAQGDGG